MRALSHRALNEEARSKFATGFFLYLAQMKSSTQFKPSQGVNDADTEEDRKDEDRKDDNR